MDELSVHPAVFLILSNDKPFGKAAEVEACLVEWGLNKLESMPAFIMVSLTHRREFVSKQVCMVVLR